MLETECLLKVVSKALRVLPASEFLRDQGSVFFLTQQSSVALVFFSFLEYAELFSDSGHFNSCFLCLEIPPCHLWHFTRLAPSYPLDRRSKLFSSYPFTSPHYPVYFHYDDCQSLKLFIYLFILYCLFLHYILRSLEGKWQPSYFTLDLQN